MYTLANYASIQKTMKYTLPSSIKQQIQTLFSELGIQQEFTIVSTPKSSSQDIIREVNKLTNDNKQTQIPIILSILNDHVTECSEKLMTILCDNSFFSSVYVELFLQLIKWNEFNEQFDIKFQQYIHDLPLLQIGDSENYDEYCDFKKKNNSLKNFTTFLMHLQTNDLYVSYYIKTLDVLFSSIDASIHLNKKDIMNEWIEHVYILTLPSTHFPIDKVKHYSTLDTIPYKFIFKCLDIIKKFDLK